MIDWNAYRRDYDTLTDEQHRDLYERVWREHPSQRSATVDLVQRFLAESPDPAVTEIGSWDGWLCETVGAGRPWVMVEICESAARAARATGATVVNPRSFRWWRDLTFHTGGALVACHVIEHLSDGDFREMALSVFPAFSAVYLEAPLLQQGPCDWTDYLGSHVMRMGWDGVRKVMADLGFVERWAEKDSVVWGKA